jgi:hypothetical protein
MQPKVDPQKFKLEPTATRYVEIKLDRSCVFWKIVGEDNKAKEKELIPITHLIGHRPINSKEPNLVCMNMPMLKNLCKKRDQILQLDHEGDFYSKKEFVNWIV